MRAVFREKLHKERIDEVEVVQADVLSLDTLPVHWENFDRVISAAMVEYLPKDHLVSKFSGIRSRLEGTGRVLLFITRKTGL